MFFSVMRMPQNFQEESECETECQEAREIAGEEGIRRTYNIST
jgi:hypothetical protein